MKFRLRDDIGTFKKYRLGNVIQFDSQICLICKAGFKFYLIDLKNGKVADEFDSLEKMSDTYGNLGRLIVEPMLVEAGAK